MIKLLALLAFLATSAFAVPAAPEILPVGLGGTGGGSGGVSGPVDANISCRRPDGTTVAGGAATTGYWGEGVICTARTSTVSSVQINVGTSFDPSVTVKWTFANNDRPAEVLAGKTWDMNVAYGHWASTSLTPSSYTLEIATINISARVCAIVAGARVCDTSETVTFAVQNPDDITLASQTICYGDDANCTNDTGASALWVNGGSGATANTVIQACNAGVYKYVMLKGGVTFSASANNITVGGQRCLVRSYGTGAAIISTTIASGALVSATNASCQSYVFNNVDFSGPGGLGARLLTVNSSTGCITFGDGETVATAGKEFMGLVQNSGGRDVHFHGFDHPTDSGVNPGYLAVYLKGEHFTFVGGSIGDSGEHLIRFPNAKGVVIDANSFSGQTATKAIIAWRGDPTFASYSGDGSISRNVFTGTVSGTPPIEFNNDNSGALTEATKHFHTDLVYNLFRQAGQNNVPRSPTQSDAGPCACGEEFAYNRYQRNIVEAFGYDSGTSRLLEVAGGAANLSIFHDVAFDENILSGPGDDDSPMAFTSISGVTRATNNLCWENGTGSCGDTFSNYAQDATNVTKSDATDPWDRDGVAPGTLTNATYDDFLITGASSVINLGGTSSWEEDIEGEASTGATEPGVDWE